MTVFGSRSISLLVSVTSAQAFSSTFNGFSQCDSGIRLEWSGGKAEPPFTFVVVPLNSSQPLVLEVPDTTDTWNATAALGSYTLPQLPLAAGTQYVTSLDDGNGFGTGGVSTLYTVGDSGGTDCLTSADTLTYPSIFKLQAPPRQCQDLTIVWNSSSSALSDRVFIRGWVPGGVAFALDPPRRMANNTAWTVDVPHGTKFVLMFSTGGKEGLDKPLETTPLLTVQGNAESDESCIRRNGSPSSTISQATLTQSASTSPTHIIQSDLPAEESRRKQAPIATIIGIVTGSLTAVLLICFILFWLHHRRRRTTLPLAQLDPQTALDARPRPFVLPNSSEVSDPTAERTSDSALAGPSSTRKETERRRERETRTRTQCGDQPTSTPNISATSGTGPRSGSSALLSPQQTPGTTNSPAPHASHLDDFSSNVSLGLEEVIVRHRDGGPAPPQPPLPPARLVELPPLYEDASSSRAGAGTRSDIPFIEPQGLISR